MVAIVTGKGVGLERSSAWVLGSAGQLGGSDFGRDGEDVTVNAATGNLVISRQDEFLIGRGADISLTRNYNSQAAILAGQSTNDWDNNDNWRMGVYRRLISIPGTYGAAGSTITRVDEDGSDRLYTWDAGWNSGAGAYVATDGAGAYDTLTKSGSTWTWTDGDSQFTETYDNGTGRLTGTLDPDGNSLAYAYDGTTGVVTQVTTADGSYTKLIYGGTGNTQLLRLETYVASTLTLTRVRYTYDGSNRLSTVAVDLSPSDSSDSDGNKYVTTYTYDSSSKRVASIAQQDGSLLQFTYAETYSGSGVYRVTSYSQTVAAGVTRTTSFDYSVAGRTTITDPAAQKTTFFYDASNQLTQISYPTDANANSRTVQFAYDAKGNLVTAVDGPGNVTAFTYDSHGNQLTSRDPLGNMVIRTYGNRNELLTETHTVDWSPTVPTSSFESPTTGSWTYNPTVSGASFTGLAGVTTDYSGFAFPVAPDGHQVGFIQSAPGNTPGAIAQTIGGLVAGQSYIASFYVAARNYGGNPLTVTFDGVTIASVMPSSTSFELLTVGFVASGTTGTLTFAGAASASDLTTAIDQLKVAQVTETTRFAYDSENHLRYAVGALGEVTHYTYDTPGNMTSALVLAGSTYSLSGINPKTSIAASTLDTWVSGISDKTGAQRTDTSYYGNGAINTVASYSKLLTSGAFDTSSELSQTTYVYSQAGQLLSRVISGSSASEVFTYDGLGRTLTATDFNGAVTRSTFLDSLGQTVVTHANGLSEISTYNKAGELIAYAKDEAGANLVDLTGWPGNPASPPSGQATVPGWQNWGAFTDETQWGTTAGPDGVPVVAIRSGQTDMGQEGGGNATNIVTVDPTKAYEFTYYFKITDLDKHYVFFGLNGNSAVTVENLNDGSDNANPYFYYAIPGSEASTYTADKWYKVVGYVLPQGTPTSSAALGGVYDAASGQKVADNYLVFRWDNSAPTTVYARFFDFYGESNQVYSTYFYQPEIRQVTTPATLTGPDMSTSRYLYDNLGRLRMTIDPTGRRNYMMYDSLNRKVADIDPDGSVIEYRYDGNDRLTSTTRYANKLNSTQLAALVDANGNPTGATFASMRPSADSTNDEWTFQAYDKAGRLVQTVDGTGATTGFVYDAASRLVSTTQYANKLDSTQLASLKASESNPNYWANPTNGAAWYYYNLTEASAGTIDGQNAFQFTAASNAWEAVVSGGVSAAAGDSVSVTFSLKAVGTATTDSFGLYGNVSGWGDYGHPDARITIASGPGTIDQYGSFVVISGLSTTEATRVTMTRTLAVGDVLSPYFYVALNGDFSAVAGKATIIAAPAMVWSHAAPAYAPTADAAHDRTTRTFYDDNGRVIATLDGAGGLTQIVYDKGGRKIRELGAAKAAASNLWATGKLSELITSVGTSTSDRRLDYVYDARGFVRYTVDALGQVAKFQTDAAGNVIRSCAFSGTITTAASYSVDYVLAQLVAAGLDVAAARRVTRAAYDSAGQKMFAIDAAGAVTAYAYDNVGNIIKQTRYVTAYSTIDDTPTLATMQSWAATHAADSGNRVSRMVYDLQGHVAYTVDAEGFVVEHQYDRAGRATKDIQYTAVYTVADGVTKESLAAQIGTLPADAVVTTYAYDADGRQSDITDGTGAVTHFAYDSLGRVTDTTIAYGTGDAATVHRAYNVLDQVVSETRGYGTGLAATTSFTYDALGNLLTSTDPRGYTVTRTYDTIGRVLTVTVPVDATPGNDLTTTNEYDAFGDLVRIADAKNVSSYRYYDALGRVWLESDREGYLTKTIYTVFGEIASVTRYAVRGSGTPTVTAPPTIVTDAKDATTSFTYDKMSRVLTVTDAEGSTETYYVDVFGQRWWVINRLGGQTQLGYDRLGQQAYEYSYNSTYYANGTLEQSAFFVKHYSYDSRGNRTSVSDGYASAESRTTTYVYDKADRVTSAAHDAITTTSTADLATTSSVTPTESYTYDVRGNVIQVVDALGGKTLSYYDVLGHKIAEVSPVGTLSAWTYDGNGNVTGARVYETPVSIPGTPGGSPPSPGSSPYRETLYGYDRANRLTTTTVASLKSGAYAGSTYTLATSDIVTSLTYDKNGNVVKESDGAGNIVWTYYDKLDRKVAQVDRENYLTVWTLDTNGNAALQVIGGVTYHGEIRYANQYGGTPVVTSPPSVSTNANDRITDFTYDKNGRRRTEKRLGVAASTVSGTGTLSTSTQDATITYVYNGLGEVTSKTEANGDVTTYTYDSAGRLITTLGAAFTDNMGTVIHLQTDMKYDALGDLVRTVAHGDVNAYQADRVTTSTYLAGGILSATTDAGGFTHTFGYDAAGRVVKDSYTRTKSDGSTVTEAIAYRYDAAGRLITQTNATWNGSNWVFSPATRIQYNAYGEVTGRGMTAGPNDTAVYQETFDYDAGGRLWRSNTEDGVQRFYVYDKAGNQTLALESAGADLSALTLANYTASIDSAGDSSTANAVTTITLYDKRGQATGTRAPDRQLTASGTATLTTARAYNAFGEVASETDGRGGVTSYSYNMLGKVTQKVSPSVNWTAENGGVASATPTENYAYDISGRLVAVDDANGHRTTRILENGSGHGDADPLVHQEFHADGGSTTIWHNVFGDERVLINELGQWEVRGFDNMGRVVEVDHPSRAAGSIGNPGGSAVQLVDYYAYDGLGQRIQHWNSQFGSSIKERTDYDLLGRVTYSADYTGYATTTSYSWSQSMATSGLGTFGGWVKTTSITGGQSASESDDYFGHVAAQTDFGGHTIAYTYDKGARVTARSNSAGESIAYTYYNAGLISGQTGTQGTATYEYDANGNRTKETFSKSGVSYRNATAAYDAMNRMTSWSDAGAGGAAPASSAWEYDKVGNVRYVTSSYRALDAQGNVAGSNTTNSYWYLYDSMNRTVVTSGELSGSRGSGTIGIGATGTLISYNLDGSRHSALYNAIVGGSRWAYMTGGAGGGWEIIPDGSGTDGTWTLIGFNFQGLRREDYLYTADGYLTQTNKADSWDDPGTQPGQYDQWGPDPTYYDPPASGTYLATTTRDALGRVTYYKEFGGIDGTFERTSIAYDYAGRETSETTNTIRKDTSGGAMQTYVTYVTNTFTNGLITQTLQDTYKNGSDSSVPDSRQTYSYVWWDGAMQSVNGNDNDNNGTIDWTTTYSYDTSGHVSSAAIADGRPRTVTFTTDQNAMIVDRDEADSLSGGDPRNLHYYYGGIQFGQAGNDGSDNMNYVASIADRLGVPGSTGGAFHNGVTTSTPFADFEQSYDAINPSGQSGEGSSYTVSNGDTLQSIAAMMWGDASLWYLLASANGLSAGSQLAAGQSLLIPDRVTNIHNNSSTFRVYDPNKALGDNSPTAIKPPKHQKCGMLGQILVSLVALAITIALPELAPGVFGSGILGGILTGVAASVGSQGFAVATGIQSKFDWKGVAMGAVSGAIGGALGAGGVFGKAGAFGGVQSSFLQGALRSAVSSTLSQGVGVATGLQKKFSFAGVAAAAVAGGLGNWAGDRLGRQVKLGNLTSGAANTITSAASLLASAATRSIIEGSDFGDNLIAGLPDVIASTIGNIIGDVRSGPLAKDPQSEADAQAVLDKKNYALSGRRSSYDLLAEADATMFPQLASTDAAVTGVTPNDVSVRIRNLRQFVTPDEWDAANAQFSADVARIGRDQALVAGLANLSAVVDHRGLDSRLLGEIEIDWQFIKDREGFRRDLYWVRDPAHPSQAHPNSGVTVGTGFDLGRRTVDGLRAMGMPEALVRKLTPYLGVRGEAARALVTRRPLVLSEREADTLDVLERGHKAVSVAQAYNAHSNVRFQDLPSGFQTAIASVHFQYGSITATPTFMRQVANQQWGAAIHNLRNFGDAFAPRRNLEADLMQRTFNAIQPRPPQTQRPR